MVRGGSSTRDGVDDGKAAFWQAQQSNRATTLVGQGEPLVGQCELVVVCRRKMVRKQSISFVLCPYSLTTDANPKQELPDDLLDTQYV